MTENQEGLDPKVVENSAGEQDFSKQAGDRQLSEQKTQAGYVSKEEFDAVVSELRGLQGKMDKDADKIEKRITSSVRDTMEALGVKLNPEQQNELRFMELQEKVRSLEGGTPAKRTSQTPVEVAEVFKALNITEPTPEQSKLALEYSGDPIQLTKALVERQLNKPNPNASGAIVSGNAGASAPKTSSAELLREFQSLQGLAQDGRLSNGKTVRQRRAEIVKELEAME